MKSSVLSLAAAASFALAQPHGHGHAHFHQKKGSPVEQRAPDVVTAVVPATQTAYLLGDKVVGAEEAKAGIAKGLYVVVGETTPSYTPAPPPSSSKVDAQFYEKTSSKVSTSTPAPVPTTSLAPAPVSTKAASSGSSYPTSGGSGVDREFPSGEIDCSHFPSDYGAVGIDWLQTKGWSSIQKVPGFSFKANALISTIVAGVAGEGCEKDSYCSYACPDGYVKSQWPETNQGATGQSVGGLLCNSQGKLELTRPTYKTLCQKGCGGVQVVNKMGDGVAICRTDYPADESMVLPTWVDGGKTAVLANIESAKYYEWQGKPTTLQYYINKKGLPVDVACRWVSPGHEKEAGNWSPNNIGVGKSSDGITYLSIFPNAPTSTAELDYDIVISGDINGDCWLKGGQFPGGSTTGCTTGVRDGGLATITLQSR